MGQFASSTYFGVMPDIMTSAKGLTNATIPMGATFVQEYIYEAFMKGPETTMELMHGYTYSGHPVACAAAIGTLDTFAEDDILGNVKKMMKPWEDAIHALKDKPRVVDIRNCGIIGAIQLEPYSADDPPGWSRQVFIECFRRGVGCRYTGVNLAFSPPLILGQEHIDQLFTTVGEAIDAVCGQ
jgi:beta-alanine--pyruvate transaminase